MTLGVLLSLGGNRLLSLPSVFSWCTIVLVKQAPIGFRPQSYKKYLRLAKIFTQNNSYTVRCVSLSSSISVGTDCLILPAMSSRSELRMKFRLVISTMSRVGMGWAKGLTSCFCPSLSW